MRRMAFSMTTRQFLERTKTVTRRQAWWELQPGERLMAIEKGMGLKSGEKQVLLGPIEVFSATDERICDITPADVIKEGFPDMTPGEFVIFYCRGNRCKPHERCRRIEFRRLD